MKTPSILLSVFLTLNTVASGQEMCDDCPCLLKQAKAMKKEGNNGKAISLFQAYVVCEPSAANEVNKEIRAIQQGAEQETAEERRLKNLAKQKEAQAQELKDIAEGETRRTRRRARSSHNLAVTLRTQQKNPTMALRMAELSLKNEPSDAGTRQVYSEIISNSDNFFYRRQTFRGHEKEIACLEVSPDGEKILTGSHDHSVRLWSQEGEPLRTFGPLPGPVLAVQFSEHSDRLLFSGAGWAIVGTEDGTFLDTLLLPQPAKEKIQAKLSPDGKYWVYNDLRGQLRLRDSLGRAIDSFNLAGIGRVNTLAFSHPIHHVLVCGDSAVVLWDVSHGGNTPFQSHKAGARDGVFSPNSEKIATVGLDSTVRLWNWAGEMLDTFRYIFRGRVAAIQKATFVNADTLLLQSETNAPILRKRGDPHPKGFNDPGNLFFKSWLGKSKLFSLSIPRGLTADNTLTARLYTKEGSYRSRLFIPDQEILPDWAGATPEEDNIFLFKKKNTIESYRFSNRRVRAYTPKKGTSRPPKPTDGDSQFAPCAGFSSNSKFFAYRLPNDSAITVRPLGAPDTVKLFLQKRHTAIKEFVVAPPKSTYTYLSVNSDGTVSLWDATARDRQPLPIGGGGRSPIQQAQFSSDGEWVLTLHADASFQMQNLKNVLIKWGGEFPGTPLCAAVSSSGDIVAVGGDDGSVRFWSKLGQEEIFPPEHGSPVEKLMFLPNSKRILTRTRTGEVYLWDLKRPEKPLKTWQGYWNGSDLVGWRDVVLSPLGNQILLVGQGNSVTLSDIQKKQVVELRGHEGPVQGAGFSADEKYLITAGQDNTARLWNNEGQAVVTFSGEHQTGITSAAISPDGRQAITLDAAGKVCIWKMPIELLGSSADTFSFNDLAANGMLPDSGSVAHITGAKALYQAAFNFFKQGDTPTAHKLFGHLLEKYPGQGADIWYNWYVTEDESRKKQALDTLMKYARPLHRVAEFFKMDGDYAQSKKVYEGLIGKPEQKGQAWIWDYFEVCEAAKSKPDTNIFLNERDTRKLIRYAQSFQIEGDREMARRLYRKSLEQQVSAEAIAGLQKINHPKDREFIQEKRALLTSRGELQQIANLFHDVEVYQKLLEKGEEAEANLGLYEISLQNPQYPFDTAQFRQTNSAEALRRYADYFEEKGDTLTKLRMLDRMIALGKADEYDWFERYLLMQSQDRETFDELLRLSSPELLSGLVNYFAAQGWSSETDEKLDWYEKAVQLGRRLVQVENNSDNRELLSKQCNSWGWYSLLNGQPETAEKAIREGIEAFSDNLFLYTNLPHALLFQGKERLEQAKEIYMRYESQEYSPERNRPYFRDAYLNDFGTFKNDFEKNPQTKFTRQMIDSIGEIEKLLKSQAVFNKVRKGKG